MFDHVGLNVRDYRASREFYATTLASLGWEVLHEWPDHGVAGFGPPGRPVFNGAPGLRWYHENYYGAFVLDPDGNNVEAVCHAPE